MVYGRISLLYVGHQGPENAKKLGFITKLGDKMKMHTAITMTQVAPLPDDFYIRFRIERMFISRFQM